MKTDLPFLQLLSAQLLGALHLLNPEGTTPTPGRGANTTQYETGTEVLISSYCLLLPYGEVIQETNFLTWVQELSLIVDQRFIKLGSWFYINSRITRSRKQVVIKTSLWKARNFKS